MERFWTAIPAGSMFEPLRVSFGVLPACVWAPIGLRWLCGKLGKVQPACLVMHAILRLSELAKVRRFCAQRGVHVPKQPAHGLARFRQVRRASKSGLAVRVVHVGSSLCAVIAHLKLHLCGWL